MSEHRTLDELGSVGFEDLTEDERMRILKARYWQLLFTDETTIEQIKDAIDG